MALKVNERMGPTNAQTVSNHMVHFWADNHPTRRRPSSLLRHPLLLRHIKLNQSDGQCLAQKGCPNGKLKGGELVCRRRHFGERASVMQSCAKMQPMVINMRAFMID